MHIGCFGDFFKGVENNLKAFFALLRAGLWENTPVHDSWFTIHDSEKVDWEEVYQLAEEQSVVGVVLQGIECIKFQDSSFKIPQELLLQWIGEVQMLEQQNKEMNAFIGNLIEKMRDAGIYALLLKGQGIAQCYDKPLWRSCGDVDLFLSEDNYQKAVQHLTPIASDVEDEYRNNKHMAMTIDSWVVELHGSLRSELSKRVDNVLDEIQRDIFFGGQVRSWVNGGIQVFLPDVNCDVVYVFTHILQHYYKGGIGLRQICDWSRILYCYRSKLDLRLLESRIKRMGLMTEWKTFAALAVEYLGMPAESMPLYDPAQKWKSKAEKICEFVLEVGNFGHNRDMSYYEKYPYIVRKIISLGRRVKDAIRHIRVFPADTLRFLPNLMYNGLNAALRGE